MKINMAGKLAASERVHRQNLFGVTLFPTLGCAIPGQNARWRQMTQFNVIGILLFGCI
jgi:hypothetical protein